MTASRRQIEDAANGARVVTTEAGDTLEQLCWEHYDSYAVLDTVARANPHLNRVGPSLPAGSRVTLPVIAAPPEASVQRFLW